jgi:hypothetical protein
VTIDVGQVLYLTTGEYSDFNIVTVVRALKQFDTKVEEADYLVQFPDRSRRHPTLLRWLLDRGVLEELDPPAAEWWYGAWS